MRHILDTTTRLYDTASRVVEAVLFAPPMRRLVAYGVYGVLPVVLVAAIALPQPWGYLLGVQAGSLAQALLLALLFLKPVAVVCGVRILRRGLVYRRPAGVAMAYVALFHFVETVQPALLFDARYYALRSHVIYGMAALAITLLLALTSNDRSVRWLRRWWLRVHRLAYPLLALVLVHSALSGGEWSKLIVLLPIYGVLKIMEWRGVRIRVPIFSAQ